MGASELALQALAFVLTYAIHSTLLLGGACLLASRVSHSLVLRERMWKTAMFGAFLTALVQVGASMETPLFHWTLASTPSAGSLAASAPSDAVRASGPARSTAQCDDAWDAGLSQQAPAASLVSSASTAGELEGAPVATSAEPAAAAPRASAPEPARERELGSNERVAADAAPAAGLLDAAAVERAPLSLNWRAWTAPGLVLWGAFALAVLGVFTHMCLRLASAMRGRTELEHGPLRERLDALVRRAYPRGRRVRLYVAPELRAPVSLGWLRPSICVPPRALSELSSDEQESMLAHELAHLLRRDPLWLSAAWLVERLFFFQPLHRVARAELHDLAELACDEWAARRTGNRLALASCLARIAEWIVGAPRSLPATSMAEAHGRCRLTQRIERLLDDEAGRSGDDESRRWIAPAAAAGLSALVLVAPGVSAAPAPAESDAPSSAQPWGAHSTTGESGASLLEALLEFGHSQPAPAPAPSAAASENALLAAELERLEASLAALRAELEPLAGEAGELESDLSIVQALRLIESRAQALERRSGALRELIQVLEELQSKPAHPSSAFAVPDPRSLP